MKYREFLQVAFDDSWYMTEFVLNDEFKSDYCCHGHISKLNNVLGADENVVVFGRETDNGIEAYTLTVEELLDSTVEYIGSDYEDIVVYLRTDKLMPMIANLTEDGIVYTHNSGWNVKAYNDGTVTAWKSSTLWKTEA